MATPLRPNRPERPILKKNFKSLKHILHDDIISKSIYQKTAPLKIKTSPVKQLTYFTCECTIHGCLEDRS